MSRIVQEAGSHGSLKNLQILINNYPSLINRKICEKLQKDFRIEWKSPLATDEYAEYRDNDFLEIIEVQKKIKTPLNDFWPRNGPQWDALGRNDDSVFLVEAKANIPESVSSPCGACVESMARIIDSLSEVKEYLNIRNEIDWSKTFYQYANRIAHLYYLKVLNNIKTYMVFVYFINDKTVDGPIDENEWKGAIQVIEEYLGLNKRHKLSKYIVDIFIDVREIGIA
jgi:hypothetical protein